MDYAILLEAIFTLAVFVIFAYVAVQWIKNR